MCSICVDIVICGKKIKMHIKKCECLQNIAVALVLLQGLEENNQTEEFRFTGAICF